MPREELQHAAADFKKIQIEKETASPHAPQELSNTWGNIGDVMMALFLLEGTGLSASM